MTQILQRLVEHFSGRPVRPVMGITDVDDKIIKRAKQRGISCSELTREQEMRFLGDLQRLGVSLPSRLTRVTEHLGEIIGCIERIMANGMAYQSEDGSVYFDLGRYQAAGFAYHRFHGNNASNGGGGEEESSWLAGKRGTGDFCLWKGAKAGEPSWPSPWGAGRPGWHIECTAMSNNRS